MAALENVISFQTSTQHFNIIAERYKDVFTVHHGYFPSIFHTKCSCILLFSLIILYRY